MIPLFYKQVARELAPKLAVKFRHLVKGGSFPACWRLAVVVPVSNEPLSSDVGGYRPIPITPLFSKVIDKIVDGKLSNFLKSNSLLPLPQFLFLCRKSLEACEAFSPGAQGHLIHILSTSIKLCLNIVHALPFKDS